MTVPTVPIALKRFSALISIISLLGMGIPASAAAIPPSLIFTVDGGISETVGAPHTATLQWSVYHMDLCVGVSTFDVSGISGAYPGWDIRDTAASTKASADGTYVEIVPSIVTNSTFTLGCRDIDGDSISQTVTITIGGSSGGGASCAVTPPTAVNTVDSSASSVTFSNPVPANFGVEWTGSTFHPVTLSTDTSGTSFTTGFFNSSLWPLVPASPLIATSSQTLAVGVSGPIPTSTESIIINAAPTPAVPGVTRCTPAVLYLATSPTLPDATVNLLVSGAHSLAITSAGSTVDLTWISTNATSCEASALPFDPAWNGARAHTSVFPSSITIPPNTGTTPLSYVYDLACISTIDGSPVGDTIEIHEAAPVSIITGIITGFHSFMRWLEF